MIPDLSFPNPKTHKSEVFIIYWAQKWHEVKLLRVFILFTVNIHPSEILICWITGCCPRSSEGLKVSYNMCRITFWKTIIYWTPKKKKKIAPPLRFPDKDIYLSIFYYKDWTFGSFLSCILYTVNRAWHVGVFLMDCKVEKYRITKSILPLPLAVTCS